MELTPSIHRHSQSAELHHPAPKPPVTPSTLSTSSCACRLTAISATGNPLVLTAGMRLLPHASPTFPTTAACVFRPVSRSRPSARPPWRGRFVHFHGWHLLHDLASHRCVSTLPFRFQTGSALFAKRQPRPFPPPFLSPPSGSFSDPLSTHDRSRDRGAVVDGELIRGRTNGDDAVYESDFLICANDGVGAWATRPKGHAGLWSRLILHYWAAAAESALAGEGQDQTREPTPTKYLQSAYEQTLEVTTKHNWQGTTTACGAQLYYKTSEDSSSREQTTPVLYITNLGDCQVLVLRPRTREVLYKSQEQWHWFDCPRQLGTNSPDTPESNAVTDIVDIEVGDVVLAMTDGVIDNLWEHEIVDVIAKSIESWETSNTPKVEGDRTGGRNGGMRAAAQDLVAAAKKIAMDPFAESPFMEHAIEEGLASEGGKLDDISVVAALCVGADET